MNSTETAAASEEPVRLMRTPRTVELEITSRCNLRCRYCYYFDNPPVNYDDLPTEEWLTFLGECGRAAVMNIVFQGGEAFMREDLRELIQGVVRNHMRFSILSNGTLIDDEWAAFLADTGRCSHVQVSVDGSCAEVHDSFRGRGSFEAAIRGVEALRRHGISTAVRMTIHRKNVRDLENTARFLLEDLGLPSFGTNAASYFGSCRRSAEEIQLTTDDRQYAMETLLALTKRYPGRIQAQAGPLAEGRMWRRMEDARQAGAAPFGNGGHLTGCGCTYSKLDVRSDGTLVPCTMLPHLDLGRINQDSLVEVWQNHEHLNALRTRHTVPLEQFEFCDGCPYVPYCTGNCPGLAYNLVGEVDHPSPDACLRRFLEEGGTIPPAPETDEVPA